MEEDLPKKDLKTAIQVKQILKSVKKSAPGGAVELRIPQYGVIQCVAGAKHRRGNPANQVEMRAEVLIQLAKDPLLWSSLLKSGQIQASGQLSDLSQVFITAFQVVSKDSWFRD
jgi:hypothetical protein